MPLQIGTKSIFEIGPGDCLLYVDVDQVPNTMPIYECNAPHDAEVFAEKYMTEALFPGSDATREQAQAYCLEQFTSYVGLPWEQSALELYYYYPTEGTWNSAMQDRLITCIVYDSAYYTGTLAGANR